MVGVVLLFSSSLGGRLFQFQSELVFVSNYQICGQKDATKKIGIEVAAWVEIFYAWRIHVMVHWRIIPVVIIIVSLLNPPSFLYSIGSDNIVSTCTYRGCPCNRNYCRCSATAIIPYRMFTLFHSSNSFRQSITLQMCITCSRKRL
jgi:hypothetical protein